MQPPTMEEPFLVAPETYLLPTPFPVPGLGLLYVNSLVIRAAEPVLVDTGAPVFRQQFLDAAFSLVDPADVRWVFLSHDDRDHSGNLMQVLEACPRARVVTNFVGVGRMGDEWALPMPRVHFANDGDRFDVGDRELGRFAPRCTTPRPPGACGTRRRGRTSVPTPSGPSYPSPVAMSAT